MSTSKDRIVEASAELFRRQGYTGPGVKQIVATASAPFASLYHFFPCGKEQLGEEVVRWSGELYGQLIDIVLGASPDTFTGVGNFFAAAADTLRETDYADACPIATVALEVASTNEPIRQACADVFENWIDKATAVFVDAGAAPDKARELSIALLMLLEGAFILCRTARTTEALEIAGAAATALAQDVLPKPKSRGARRQSK
jgi:AcrR family transcriptional regulator